MRRLATINADGRSRYDYSEEAIPERDPSYRSSDGTWDEDATVDAIPAEKRLALAMALEQLGFSAVRARLLTTL